MNFSNDPFIKHIYQIFIDYPEWGSQSGFGKKTPLIKEYDKILDNINDNDIKNSLWLIFEEISAIATYYNDFDETTNFFGNWEGEIIEMIRGFEKSEAYQNYKISYRGKIAAKNLGLL